MKVKTHAKDIRIKIYYILIITVVLISIIPLLMICKYNAPSVDDYSYAAITFQVWNDTHSIAEVIKAALNTTIYFWNTWQGLYASAFLLSLQPAIFGTGYYAFTGIIMLGLIIGSITIFSIYFIKKLFKGSLLEGIAIASLMSFLIIQYMPSCVEGLYWFNGAMNYGFFFAVLLVYICLLIELQRGKNVFKETLLYILCFISTFLLEGGNHVTALMGVVFTFIIFCLCWKRGKKKTIGNFILLCAAIFFLCLNLGSPGTKIRMNAINGNVSSNGFLATIFWAAWKGIENVGRWLGFKEIVFLIFALPIFTRITIKLRKEFSFKFRYPLLVIIASVEWLSLMYCPPLYAMNSTGSGRLENIVYYSFVVLLFFNAAYIVGWLENFIDFDTIGKINVSNWKYIGTVIILIISVFISDGKNSWAYEALKEIRTGEAQIYLEEFCERETIILDSKGLDVSVLAYSVHPKILYFDDIEKNADDWRNVDTAAYYSLKSIVLK